MSLPSDGRGDAAFPAPRAREPAADPADDGITTVTVTLLEDPRGGAARVSRKRENLAPLVGDHDNASPCHGDERDFDFVRERASAEALHEGDDVWNAVLTAFEAHCLRGGDTGTAGDGAEVAAFDADAAATEETFPGAPTAPETSPSLRPLRALNDSERAETFLPLLPSTDADGGILPMFGTFGTFGTLAEESPAFAASGLGFGGAARRDGVVTNATNAPAPFFSFSPSFPSGGSAPPDAFGAFDAEPLDASASEGGVPSASAAELVRAHAARALRSLIFGRDDGRGRRRCAVEGPRVSRRRGKKKEAAAAAAAAAAEDRDRDPDDASLGAHYARRDPARWRAAATTASSVAAMKASAEAASRRAASDPLQKIAALRANFAVELERLAVVERGLVAGERGALARISERERERDAASFAVHSVAPEATRAMRDSAAARFRECRFRILETFERDVAGVARGDSRALGSSNATNATNDDVEKTPSFVSPHSFLKATREPYGARETERGAHGKRRRKETSLSRETRRLTDASRESPAALPDPPVLPHKKEGGKSRHSARARAVLKTWLAEHFYPTETRSKPVPTREEKKRLALETGLTERQVGDWFVNARARVWKPTMQTLLMEEM